MSIREIAKRAGVGAGTVGRHFPTKESLIEAIFVTSMQRILDRARVFAAEENPVAAFFDLFEFLVRDSAHHKGLSDALSGAGFDMETTSACHQRRT